MSARRERGFFREIVGIVVPALLIAVAVQAFAIKPFRIPSESMLPNLMVGDYLFVSKYSYGYSRYSLPFSLPLFSGRLFAAEPKRGDVVVFRLPTDDRIDFIKRVVGLPGDRIQMANGTLIVNGVPVPRRPIDDFVVREGGSEMRAARHQETLPDGKSYETIDLTPDGPLDNTGIVEVPPGHYFMMGDNRDDSADSRVPDEVGFVPFDHLVGRAERIFFSVRDGASAHEFWRWPWSIRSERLFKPIR